MTYLPSFNPSSGAYASQNQWGNTNYGKINSQNYGQVRADHFSASGVLGQNQSVKGNGQVGGDQSLKLFTIDPARGTADSFQAGGVNHGALNMKSTIGGSTTPSTATMFAQQSASLHGTGGFASGNTLSAEAG